MIRVTDIGKRFRIDQRNPRNAMHEFLEDVIRAPFRRLSSGVGEGTHNHNGTRSGKKYVWALRGVSFQAERGDVIGLVGSNGAGKSVLLKVLSRVTRPTEGYAEIYGKVGSMLEVGTGFHPELTGRENIFLSGAILGMKKPEIGRKFDEIVAFSEVEEFLDTPVKRYSSGMNVRLAFAIAAHLEPEIILMDEVLAVGDEAFKSKCLDKMKEVASQGRTVLFVSHNMKTVENLCNRAIYLVGGRLEMDGATDEVVSRYLSGNRD